MHKLVIISKTIEEQNSEYIICLPLKDLKIRTIVAGHNCPTKWLNNFVDVLLKYFLSKVQSYIKDDLDFSKKCKRKLNRYTKFVCLGVTSLCKKPQKAIEYWFDQCPELICLSFNKTFFLKALKLILKNNNSLSTMDIFINFWVLLWVQL